MRVHVSSVGLIHLFLYFCLAAKKAKTSRDLISELQSFDFPASQDTERFVQELQSRLPRKNSGLTVSYLLHYLWRSLHPDRVAPHS